MRLRHYFYFIKKRLSTGLRISLLGFVISVLGFSLLVVAISIPRVVTRAYRDLDRLLPPGLEHTGYVAASAELKDNSAEWDGFSECIKELCSVEGIRLNYYSLLVY